MTAHGTPFRPTDHGAVASTRVGATAAVLGGVAAGRAEQLFPPVLGPGPDGTLAVVRDLGGPADARRLGTVLATDRFAPVRALFDDLAGWCGRAYRRWADVLAPGVLDVTSGDLFGPLVSDALVACTGSAGGPADRERVAAFVAGEGRRYLANLDLFLDRFARDLPGRRVLGLWANGEETHNGRQRVLRVDLDRGERLAYKPRPAGGEALFTAAAPQRDGAAPPSVFALLNELPPASGPVELPVLRCWTGGGRDRGRYWWQEWVEPPADSGVLARDGARVLTGPILAPPAATSFWRRAGSFTAAAFGFGFADLHGDNVLAGARAGEPVMLHPVDLEVFFTDVVRLSTTGLVHDPAAGKEHHVGLENEARWCSPSGADHGFREAGDALELVRRTRPLTRESTRSVVGDTLGRIGYGPYLATFMRGMFDAWTLMCRHRDRLASGAAAADVLVRVVRRSTSDYVEALVEHVLSSGARAPGEPFDVAEREQLRRGDVPYFCRAATGGPLLRVEPSTGEPVPAAVEDATGPPVAAVAAGERLTLSGLGIALRDAAQYAFDGVPDLDVTDEDLGVRLRLHTPRHGHVSFDWPATGRRIGYAWEDTKVRVRLDPLGAPEPADPSPGPSPAAAALAGLRERLLRVDRLDAGLRAPWTATGFADEDLGGRLRRLTGSALAWFSTVLDEHGWPGRSRVGLAATTAASRLVQHVEGDPAFQRRCLELMRQAAGEGELPRREVAYVTDALRLAEGRPQVYGTKFRPAADGGALEPYPLEDPGEVDERRASMGLDGLDRYAERLRGRFGPDLAAATGSGGQAVAGASRVRTR